MEKIDNQSKNKKDNNIEKPDLWQDIRQYLEQPQRSNTEESGMQLGNDSSQDLQNGRENLCEGDLDREENQSAQQGQNLDQYQKQNTDQSQLPTLEFGSAANNSTNKSDFRQFSDNIFNSNKGYNTTNDQIDNEYNLMDKPLPSNTKLRQNSSIIIAPELKKKRQLLLVLPLLVLPFVSMAFWALGGGELAAGKSDRDDFSGIMGTGINTKVPKADLGNGMTDKMTAYREAAKLVAETHSSRLQDGYLRGHDSLDALESFSYPNATDSLWHQEGEMQHLLAGSEGYADQDQDPNTLKVQQKLAALQKMIASTGSAVEGANLTSGQQTYPATYGLQSPGAVVTGAVSENTNKLSELSQLKAMIAASSDLGDAEETNQINAMLDKVLAIQQGYKNGKIEGKNQKVSQGGRYAGYGPGSPLGNGAFNFAGTGREVGSSRSGKIYHLTPINSVAKVPLLATESLELNEADKLRENGLQGLDIMDLNTGQITGHKTQKLPLNSNTLEMRPAGMIKGAFYDIDDKYGNDSNGRNGNGHDNSLDTRVYNPGYEDTYSNSGNSHSKGNSNDNVDDNAKNANNKELTTLTIPASVASNQTLVSGSTIKLRLDKDIQLNEILIPKGSFVFGTCQVNGERLRVAINHIRYKKQLLPVNLKVYDLDGLDGIHIPGSINRDAAKQGVDRGLSSMQLMNMDASVAAQAASAGVEAAKGLFSKKVRLIRVTVKAGYPILLVDGKD